MSFSEAYVVDCYKAADPASQGQLVQSTSPLIMCCAVGESELHQKNDKKNKNLCHITGKAPHQAPKTTLQLTLPRSFSLRENLIKKLVCTRGGEGGGRVLWCYRSPCVCWETSISYNISPTVYNKEKEQSQKKKSASKGTGSPVLWQVGESAERPHGLPWPRGVWGSLQAEEGQTPT